MNKSSEDFYRNLPEIRRFIDIVDLKNYSPVPDDWLIVATDIRGSTDAIRSGEYKSVNMAGACAIAAISNDFPDLDIPFVFGGDGAIIALPDVGRAHIMGLLRYCKEAAQSIFGLELAAGCQSMGDLRKIGKEVKIGKFRLSDHVKQAIFWGNGIDYIEEFIKLPGSDLLDFKTIQADFNGLECRWSEIPSEKGEVLSMIIKSILPDEREKSRFYKTCFEEIETIYGSADQYKPVSADKMVLSSNPFNLKTEVGIKSYPASLIKKITCYMKLFYLQLAGKYLMKNNIQTKNTNWGNYKSNFIHNADFRKFSDGLKLVVSGTKDQRDQLRSFLETCKKRKEVVFGLHASPAAMSTCFVTNYHGQHIHFIDGTEGGYAAASVELKQQLKELHLQKTRKNGTKEKCGTSS